MDPNTALQEIRELYTQTTGGPLIHEDADRLAELVMGLDEWLSKGGFLPTDWARAPLNT